MNLSRIVPQGLAVALWATTSAMSEPAQPFTQWLDEVRAEATSLGISHTTLDAALADVAPIPRILELDRSQPESRITFANYLQSRTPQERIERGRRLLEENRDLLEEIGAAYGVQPRFIVALWGMETSYGNFTGGYPVIDALATLAYDGRRGQYFRRELMKALQIVDEGHVTVGNMTGSWAGAMGQSQFMPSSFLHLAVDHNGDGRRDIWTTRADVFASAANFLSEAGWNSAITWGREVRVPTDIDPDLADLRSGKSLGDWQALGVRRADGKDLPRADLSASLVLPDGAGGKAFLVYDNFKALMNWNRSTYFAATVGILADRIGDCTDGPGGYGCAY